MENQPITEFKDIQAILLSGYATLPHARFVLVQLDESAKSRAWVGKLVHMIRHAEQGAPMTERCTHIAFSFPGLERLGLSWQALKGFSREFQEGMAGSQRRTRIFGDIGRSAPENWHWGGPRNDEVHAVLMLYAATVEDLDGLLAEHRDLAATEGVALIHELPSQPLANGKEHFGFRDGISQPKLAGISGTDDKRHLVKRGEFILGYANERHEFTAAPLVDAIEDPDDILPKFGDGNDLHDFGKNGSYMVFRQLSQDVHGFWLSLDQVTRSADGQRIPNARIALGAKMVGRWPGGAPLVKSPDRDAAEFARDNDFGYHDADVYGLSCPIGAHIRRTNPRDMLEPGPGTEKSLEINRRHRLLRRGRPYGPPLAPSFNSEEVLAGGDDGIDRGLHFICFNANISRQFEFVQHTWVNNANFAGLQAETDPIIGTRPATATAFTTPAKPVRKRFDGLPRFVEVNGGAYFFLPGIKALRYLATAPKLLASAYSAPAAAPVQRQSPWWLGLARGINTGLEYAVTLSRRCTWLRNQFDRIFQLRITNLIQWLIQRRRTKYEIDIDLDIAQERMLPNEAEITQRITEVMTAFLFKHYRTGIAERAGNTKTYGLLKATFDIESGLEDTLRQGVFSDAKSFSAWVRFGGPGPLVTPDIKNNGVLSIGVKLTGVPGPKLLDQEQTTQDFTGISAPTFTTADIIENLKLQQHIGARIPTFYFLNPFDSHYFDMILQGLYAKAHGSPFETPYWSCVPYLYGEGRAMKYSFVPQRTERTPVPFPAPDDYLRDAMVKNLSSEICFDFKVQFQTNASRMPLEDASVIWSSEFVKVATLRIPPQEFTTPKRDMMARQISFNPWHAIEAHRPLGNQNRARKQIYLETSRVRQRINNEEHVEPKAERR